VLQVLAFPVQVFPAKLLASPSLAMPMPKEHFFTVFNRGMIVSEPTGLRGRISSAAIPKQLNTRITDYI